VAVGLKERYQGKWVRSNKRERLVIEYLNDYLPFGFRAELRGLGAGSNARVDGWHSGMLDAFDIVVYYNGVPAAFIDVTGVDSVDIVRQHKCRGYCVGSWKLGKAKRYNVLEDAWIAFVVDDEPRILWLPLAYLDHLLASPHTDVCRLYRDERVVYCLSSRYWRKAARFFHWLVTMAQYKAKLKASR